MKKDFIFAPAMLIIGIFEAILVGWFFKTSKVLDEVNRNTIKFKKLDGVGRLISRS